MRLAAYAGTSALAAAGALLKAFHQRPNFYSATVYLSQSNACILILTNLALVAACSTIYGLQRLFYGPLRPVEIEQLSEKAWYAVLDTLLAMPSLRDEVGGWMLAVFVLLLAAKVWSWIGEGRVDILEQQPPQNPRLFHARLSSSLLLSVAFNIFMCHYCTTSVMENPRPGMMVIFTFEFAILAIFSLFTLFRYGLALVEARILKLQTKAKMDERRAEIRAERARLEQERQELPDPQDLPALPSEDDVDENEIDVPGWEDKRRWLFGLELATDFVKLVIYTIFFGISLTFMGLPMHIIRDVYLTFTAFVKRLQDYNNYRKATNNMNTRYPDATTEELSNDNTCIVCRETMVPWDQPNAAANRMNEGVRAKKLPCGHILHLRCLKAWLERQQACPTCRRPVIPDEPSATNNAAPGNQGAAPGPNGGLQRDVPGANAAPGAANAGNGGRGGLQDRLRMINLGPIRIGLYNGPANQVQEALAQRQAQQQPDTSSAGITGMRRDRRGFDMQLQLLQMEQRLIQDTQRLHLESAQLATVRALEAELSRLRAEHSRVSTSSHAGASRETTPAPTMRNIFNPTSGTGAASAPMTPQVLQPQQGQAPMTAGHEGLPPGLVLPEGWTLAPLHRLEGAPALGGGQQSGGGQQFGAGQMMGSMFQPSQTPSTPVTTSAASPSVAPHPTTPTPSMPIRNVPATSVSAPEAPDSNASTNGSAPVNDGLIPSDAQTESASTISTSNGVHSGPEQPPQQQYNQIDTEPNPTTNQIAAPETTSTMPEVQATSSSEVIGQLPQSDVSGWSFDNLENDGSNSQSQGEHEQQQQSEPTNKGKGKAVTVEEAEDAEN